MSWSGDVPNILYVPVLKGRQGEFGALGAIQPVTRQHTLPLVEIVPAPTDDRTTIRSNINKTVKRLRTWAGSRLLLDAGLLPVDLELQDGFGPVGYSVITALRNGVAATPVVRLSDEPLALADASQIHADGGGGVAIRLNVEDMDEDALEIDQALTDALRRLKVDRPEADLILDIGAVNGDLSVRHNSRLVTDLLRDLTDIGKWREIIVTAGAFPPDLSAVERGVIGQLPRYDAALWDHLQGRRRGIAREPKYGDYAVAHPALATGAPFPVAPQLRYTVATQWLVLEGGRNDPRGHEQFYDVCEAIAGHAEFAGAALGKADARIANARTHGPGNASIWREIATTHHLDYVVRRITILGEP